MSDHDTAPDPMDRAYVQAEAVLDDEAARAARRARVLAAVASEAETPSHTAPPPSRPRLSWGRGGWLAAASVAGLSAFLAFQLYAARQAAQPAKPEAAAADAAAASNVDANAPAPATATAPAGPSRAETRLPRHVPAASPPPQPRFQSAPAPAPAPPPASADASEAVVTGSRVASAPRAAYAPSEAKAAIEAPALTPPAALGAKLRAAAAAGRIAELRALLTQGAPVDAPDDDGETALMKTVQANHPAAAALLRRHGASLDFRNRAGVSARDMATSMGDPELDRALGLAPRPDR